MEESKYYTPEVEELFCHLINEGIVYSKVIGDEGWKSFLHEADNIPTLVKSFVEMNDYTSESGYDINEDLYRLKYLDQKDIESLGFVAKTPYDGMFRSNKFIKYETIDYTLNLLFNDGNTWVEMYVMCNHGSETLFYGRCKNKSELKRVLKQIGYENS